MNTLPLSAPVVAGSSVPAATGGPAVVGLDLSLTGTGYAGPNGTQVITSTGHQDDTLAQRAGRLGRIQAQILAAMAADFAPGPTVTSGLPDLVVIEAPSLGQGRQGGTHDRSGLWWLVVYVLFNSGVEVLPVPPATLKKYATGSGRAEKSDVRMAVYKRFGIDIANNNEADAFVLRAIGHDLAGDPLAPLPAANRAALDKLPRATLRGMS